MTITLEKDAQLYNKALIKDGLSPIYSQENIDGYLNSTGENDILYPDVDYHN